MSPLVVVLAGHAKPNLPDQSLRALSAYLLWDTLPITLMNCAKVFDIAEWIPLVGFFLLAFSPLLIYYIFEKYPIFINRYSPATFEWSYYASLMGILTLQACLMVGIGYGMALPMLLGYTICLILPMLAVNLRKEKSLVNYRYDESPTYPDIAILTVYFFTVTLIIYFFPMGMASFGENCLNPLVCSSSTAKDGVYKQKGALMAATIYTLSTLFGCLKMWRARELVMELSNEETGEVKQTILERRGWKWVVKGEEKLKIQ